MSDERRSKVRYPLELAVRYQGIGEGQAITGVGRTLNLSSSGLLLASEEGVQPGARLKVTIEWPSLLNGKTPLQLVTVGRVVRQGRSNFAVAFEHYQFKTMSRKPLAMSVASDGNTTSPELMDKGRPAFEPRSSTTGARTPSELQQRVG